MSNSNNCYSAIKLSKLSYVNKSMETLDKAPGQELDNILKLAMRFLQQQHPGLEVSRDLTFVLQSTM